MIGLMLLFFGLGAILAANYSQVKLKTGARILGMVTHGVGLLFLLVGGFGMLAKMGIMGQFPGWVHGKLLIWLLLGAGVSLAKRKAQWGWMLATAFIILGAISGYLALFKPF
jgi:hypothetical protein